MHVLSQKYLGKKTEKEIDMKKGVVNQFWSKY